MMMPIVEFWIWEKNSQGDTVKVSHTGIILHWYEDGNVCVMDCETKIIHKVALTPDRTKVLGFRQSMEIFDGQP